MEEVTIVFFLIDYVLHIRDLDISRHSSIVLVKRRNKALIPNGNRILREGDSVFVYTRKYLADASEIEL